MPDCSLAMPRERLPLATLDTDLRSAAAAAGVELLSRADTGGH